jgi:hypothetical protein
MPINKDDEKKKTLNAAIQAGMGFKDRKTENNPAAKRMKSKLSKLRQLCYNKK